jgi:excisionase family DNA binding protein
MVLETRVKPEGSEARNYEPLLSDVEAAKFLGGLHPKTVQRMARRGELPAYRVARYWRFRASELDSWLKLQSQCQNPSAQAERRCDK